MPLPAIVLLYIVGLGVPIAGGLAVHVVSRFAGYFAFFSGSARLGELRRHAAIAGCLGFLGWFGLFYGANELSKRQMKAERAAAPPVALSFASACETPVGAGRRATIDGYLAAPRYGVRACDPDGTCLLELFAEDPSKERGGTLVHVRVDAGAGVGQLSGEGDSWTIRSTSDGSRLDATTRVRIIGTRNTFGYGQCSFHPSDLFAARN